MITFPTALDAINQRIEKIDPVNMPAVVISAMVR